MIRVQNISKSFDGIKAVDDISFSVKKGEIVGFLGPNGAGKTTTMRMITGFFSPDRGKITIQGEPVEGNSIYSKSSVGYLPENNPLYQDMLVSEYLSFMSEIRNIQGKKKKKQLSFAVEKTGISQVYHYPIRELSKGYRQRVGMAGVLLVNPSILILDEPTEGLDPNQRTEVRNLIKTLAKEHTVILSTHVMQEVTSLCKRVIIIHKGKLVADSTCERLVQSAKKGSIVHTVIEGKGLLTKIKKLKNVDKVELLSRKKDTYELLLYSKEKYAIQRSLIPLCAQQHWLLKQVKEEEESLEQVFRKLTT